MARIYYRMNTGELCRPEDVEQAFWIMTGKHRKDYEGKYIRFLHNLFIGGRIKKAMTMTCGELVDEGHRVWAIVQYREEAGCGLMEARKFINEAYPD